EISGARPSGHVDASATETPTTGAAKLWLAHVGGTYADVPSSHPAYRFIETLAHHGVSAGCGGGRFCPDAPVSRRQLSLLLLRAKLGASYTPPASLGLFVDLASGNPFAPWVEDLYARGVFAGCDAWQFCPDDGLRRAELAVYLLRAIE